MICAVDIRSEETGKIAGVLSLELFGPSYFVSSMNNYRHTFHLGERVSIGERR